MTLNFWMRHGALILALIAASAVLAQDRSKTCDHMDSIKGVARIGVGGDRIVMARDGSGWRLCYENARAKASNAEGWRIEADGFEVRGSILVDDAETILITPPPGWMVWPADAAESDVEDGEAVTVRLISGLM